MNVLTQLSRYFFIILMLFFALEDYLYFGKRSEEARDRLISRQIVISHAFVLMSFLMLFLHTREMRLLLLAAGIILMFIVTIGLYQALYPNASMLLVNNMLMMLGVGLVMIARLDIDKAIM